MKFEVKTIVSLVLIITVSVALGSILADEFFKKRAIKEAKKTVK